MLHAPVPSADLGDQWRQGVCGSWSLCSYRICAMWLSLRPLPLPQMVHAAVFALFGGEWTSKCCTARRASACQRNVPLKLIAPVASAPNFTSRHPQPHMSGTWVAFTSDMRTTYALFLQHVHVTSSVCGSLQAGWRSGGGVQDCVCTCQPTQALCVRGQCTNRSAE